MFEREISRWQRAQKQMKSAQARYDAMEPPDAEFDSDEEELAEMRRREDQMTEWAISRMEARLER